MVQGSASPDERNKAIYVAVVDGATFAQVAEQYGISRNRVREVFARERDNAWTARRLGETSYLGRPFPADV